MEVNVLVIGDPHFMDSEIKETDELTGKLDQLTSMIGNKFSEINKIFLTSNFNEEDVLNIDFIVILGDLLHKHGRGEMMAHVHAIRILKMLKQKLPVFVLIGNHDRSSNNDFLSDYHYFTGMTELENLYIIDKVKIYTISKSTDSKIIIRDKEESLEGNSSFDFIFVPYVPNGRFIEALNTKSKLLKFEKTPCIFAHQEFKGAKYNRLTSENGDDIPISLPLIISGHIHERGLVSAGKIIYIGSSRQIAKNEDPDKVIGLFTFVNNGDRPSFKQKNISLNLIKKVTVRIHHSKVNEFVPPPNTLTYLIIQGTTAEIRMLKKLQSFKELSNIPNVKISYEIKDNDESILDSGQKIEGFTKTEHVSYISKLKELIKDDPTLLQTFNSIFYA